VDGSVYSATSGELRVGGVDNGVRLNVRDILLLQPEQLPTDIRCDELCLAHTGILPLRAAMLCE
jgi:hypothetical protein